ncbi:MAG: acylneuraminate cytidylyltransferase family protein [Hydrogenophaga sp.]|uniref:acylneuraminate cytidylyltransferase family protein n=1 Tax=Hydrogenophaga sp. TaxID=1904254 RepID=UPI00263983D9|nr:acylneuraminate cytidylyltransferase family protein [Hydrogenophaga sp.]MDM7941577.1 acylneuraminate cytidylyltransferase family protein [Hydrogenophaga sp.]
MPLPTPAWTAVIPLRAGSKGLPSKNIRPLAGKPLYRHAVDQALQAGASRVVITTDIPEVLWAELPAEVTLVERPSELSGDSVPMAPVLQHALHAADCHGTVVLLQATSPLRRCSDIDAALAVFAGGYFELVMSVTSADRGVLKWGTLRGNRFQPLSDPAYCFANRQSLPPVVRPNGALYVLNAERFVASGSFVSERIGVVEMPVERSQDIDSLEDFERCEAALGAAHGE